MSGKPINAKSVADQLEADNKQMAARLQQLKLTLKKQKQQRGGKSKGVIWRSSTTTPSAIKVAEKGAAGRRRPRLPGSGGSKRKTAATAGKITSDEITPHPPSAMPTFKAAPPPARTSVNNPADMLELKGEESDLTPEEEEVSGGDSEEFDEGAGHAGFLDALNAWRTGVPAGSPSKQKSSSSSSNTGAVDSYLPASKFGGSKDGYIFKMDDQGLGYYRDVAAKRPAMKPVGPAMKPEGPAMKPAGFASSTTYEVGGSVSGGVGTDGGNSLADGDYDEAASAAAFRAAVAEWRAAPSEGAPAAAAATTTPAAAPAKGMWSMPADPVAVQSFETQTQPAAAKPAASTAIKFKTGSNLTYMEKLMLARHRKQGGNTRPVSGVTEANLNTRGGGGGRNAASPELLSTGAGTSASAASVHDPEGWLQPLASAGRASINELANGGSNRLEISEVLDFDGGNSDDGAATPFKVDQPSDSSSDEERFGGGGGGGGAAAVLSRPNTASRTFTMTPDGAEVADADVEATENVEVILVEVEEYFEEDAEAEEAGATVTTPTRATASSSLAMVVDADATPMAAAAPSRQVNVSEGSGDEAMSDDSEAEEMVATMAAEISAQVKAAALSNEELTDSPHRNIITPGMMHDFEEMEEKLALI